MKRSDMIRSYHVLYAQLKNIFYTRDVQIYYSFIFIIQYI